MAIWHIYKKSTVYKYYKNYETTTFILCSITIKVPITKGLISEAQIGAAVLCCKFRSTVLLEEETDSRHTNQISTSKLTCLHSNVRNTVSELLYSFHLFIFQIYAMLSVYLSYVINVSTTMATILC